MRFPFRHAFLLLFFLGLTVAAAAEEENGGDIVVVTECASLKRAIESTSTASSTDTDSSNTNDSNTNTIKNTSNTRTEYGNDSNRNSGGGRGQGGNLTILLQSSSSRRSSGSRDDDAVMICAESIHVSPSQSIVLRGAADGSSVISIAPDLVQARRRDQDWSSLPGSLLQDSRPQGPLAPGEGGRGHRTLFFNEGVLQIENVVFRLGNSNNSGMNGDGGRTSTSNGGGGGAGTSTDGSSASSTTSIASRNNSSDNNITSSREGKRTRRWKTQGKNVCGGARVVLNSGHLVIGNSTFDRSLAGPSGCGVTTGVGQVVSGGRCAHDFLIRSKRHK